MSGWAKKPHHLLLPPPSAEPGESQQYNSTEPPPAIRHALEWLFRRLLHSVPLWRSSWFQTPPGRNEARCPPCGARKRRFSCEVDSWDQSGTLCAASPLLLASAITLWNNCSKRPMPTSIDISWR